MNFLKVLWFSVCCFIVACGSDGHGAERAGNVRFVGNSVIRELRDGEIVHSVRAGNSPDHQLRGLLFVSDNETVWGVKEDLDSVVSLSHWDLEGEALLEEVALPPGAEYEELFLTEDAVWLVGGAGTVSITKVSRAPLEVVSTMTLGAKWFNGGHISENGLDILLSNGTELLRIDTKSGAIVASVELNPLAGVADMVLVGDEYWIALRGSSKDKFARLAIADLTVLETSTDPAPWPGHNEAYGYQKAMANDEAIYADRSEYLDGRNKGCIVRVPLDDPPQAQDLFCVDPDDSKAVLGDFFVSGDEIWVVNDLYGRFVRIDSRTGQIMERINAVVADAFFL